MSASCYLRPRITTYYHILPRAIVQAERSCCISGSQPQTSAEKFLHLGQPTANIGRKVFASRTASPACRPGVFACRPNTSHVETVSRLRVDALYRMCRFPPWFQEPAAPAYLMESRAASTSSLKTISAGAARCAILRIESATRVLSFGRGLPSPRWRPKKHIRLTDTRQYHLEPDMNPETAPPDSFNFVNCF